MSDSVYGKHFVAFFDILGFSEIVKADMSDEQAREKIEFFDQALQECRKRAEALWSWETHEFSVKMFSDCICVSVPAADENVDAFFQILAYLQSVFVFNGISLRGGVTVGRHFLNEQMIFSAALVEAYKLEHRTKQPRIVVSDALCDYVMKDVEESDDNISLLNAAHFQHTYVMRDPDDGIIFLDYLNFMPAEADGGERLRQHRDWIVENLKAYKGDTTGILAKYQWLRGYHNRWCGIYEKHRADLADFLVLH